MLPVKLTLLLLTTTLANPTYKILAEDATDDEYGGYRLPGNQIPSDYKLNIAVTTDLIENKNNTFEGDVEISFTVKEDLDSLQIHAPMNVRSVILTSNTEDVTVKDFSNLNTTTSIRTITLDTKIVKSSKNVLKISYAGEIDPNAMSGLYRSSYTNEKGEKEYLLTTQFEPVSARKAFPCFDEPNYKATFTLTLTYPDGYNAVSNTAADKDEAGKVTFKTTPKISTYLIAFVVSKFTCTEGDAIEDKIAHRVCSRNEAENNRNLSKEYGKKILNKLEEFTGIQYGENIGKMDEIAIPDFQAGAMENWGLVTYRERLLLFDDDESPDTFKQSIVTVIAHEFSHQWFGDLVTCHWWDDIFLNEGFAAYFQYFILTELEPTWELEKQFIVTNQQPILVDDGFSTTKAVTAKVASPEDIAAKFDTIVYNKGASIIRMVENVLGTDKFKLGLQNYLKTNSLKAAKPSNLISALAEQAKDNTQIPSEVDFTKFMTDWIDLEGYPVLSVSQRGKILILKQARFLYDEKAEKTESESIWTIPISLTLGSDENKFESVAPKYWLNKTTDSKDNVFSDTNSWIIVNNQQSAYYRVQYGQQLWERIATQLQKDPTQIHVLNRAQIADDLFNFARASNGMTYSKAFTYLQYLNTETEYYPWVSALNNLNYLLSRVGEDTKLGTALKSKVVELLNGIYTTLSFETDTDSTQIESMKKDLVFNAACKYGNDDCIDNVNKLFKTYKTDNKIDKNLKKVVYCYGLKNSDDVKNDWKLLWDKYRNTKLSTEQITILGALGCTNNNDLLKNYLDFSLDETKGIRVQDLAAVWSSIYTSTPQGVQTALDYLLENHAKILKYFSDAPTLLTGIASQITKQEQIDALNKFLSGEDVDQSYKSVGKRAIESATKNLAWLESNREDLEEYLGITTTTTAATTTTTAATTTTTAATTTAATTTTTAATTTTTAATTTTTAATTTTTAATTTKTAATTTTTPASTSTSSSTSETESPGGASTITSMSSFALILIITFKYLLL